MSPIESIRELTKSNPAAASLLLAGIGCFAAVAIVYSFGLDPQSTLQPAIYIIAMGALVTIVVGILFNKIMMAVLQWFLILVVILWFGSFAISRASPETVWASCFSRFWESCRTTADVVAADASRSLPPIRPAEPVPPDSQVVPGSYQVFVQFAGILDRDNVRSMMQSLADAGWQVQGVSGGGQRTGTAAGFNEVRYRSDADAAAALALAASIQSTKIVPSKIKTVLTPAIRPGTLEVYISR